MFGVCFNKEELVQRFCGWMPFLT